MTEFSPAQHVSGPVGFPSFLPRALSFSCAGRHTSASDRNVDGRSAPPVMDIASAGDPWVTPRRLYLRGGEGTRDSNRGRRHAVSRGSPILCVGGVHRHADHLGRPPGRTEARAGRLCRLCLYSSHTLAAKHAMASSVTGIGPRSSVAMNVMQNAQSCNIFVISTEIGRPVVHDASRSVRKPKNGWPTTGVCTRSSYRGRTGELCVS